MKENIESILYYLQNSLNNDDPTAYTEVAIEELQQMLDEPDDLTIAYMAGVERGKDAIRAEIKKCEPVARVVNNGTNEGGTEWIPSGYGAALKCGDLLYTRPKPTQRLSSDEIKEIVNDYAPADNPLIVAALAHHIQDALLEKNK